MFVPVSLFDKQLQQTVLVEFYCTDGCVNVWCRPAHNVLVTYNIGFHTLISHFPGWLDTQVGWHYQNEQPTQAKRTERRSRTHHCRRHKDASVSCCHFGWQWNAWTAKGLPIIMKCIHCLPLTRTSWRTKVPFMSGLGRSVVALIQPFAISISLC